MTALVYVMAAAGVGATLAAAGVALVGRRQDMAFIEAVARSRANASDLRPAQGIRERIAAWAEGQPFVARLSPTLALADVTLASVISKGLAAAGVLALLGALLPVGFAVLGVTTAAYLVPFGAIGGALFGLVVVVNDTKNRASRRRRHLRQSFASYISLTALAMAGSMGLESAVHAASRVSNDWVFATIRTELETIRLTKRPVYSVFEVLGSRFGESDLSAVASSLRQSLESGTGARDTLEAKADSLRDERMAALEADAGKLTQKMFLPTSIMFFGYLIVLAYPAISHIAVIA